LTTSYSYSK